MGVEGYDPERTLRSDSSLPDLRPASEPVSRIDGLCNSLLIMIGVLVILLTYVVGHLIEFFEKRYQPRGGKRG